MVKNKNGNDTKSRAEQILSKELRGQVAPEVTPRMAKGVSQYRRGVLEEEVENGLFREQGSGRSYKNEDDVNKLTSAGFVTYLSKKAQTSPVSSTSSSSSSSSSSSGWRGSHDTVRQMGEMYSPLWLNSNLSLPRERATINAWSRSFFALNPIVHNAITLHSTYPIAKLNIKCKNKKVEQFFSQMMEEIDLMNICVQVAQEYWVLGEAFVYADLDEATGKWSRLSILNPDYVNVQRSVIAADPILSLRPDENLRRVVFGNKPSDIQQRKQLSPSVIEHVRKNENIPLNNFYISHIARRISPYENRGTGLIVSCFRSLMYYDKSLECKFVQADTMINPLTLVKIGDADFKPSPVDLEHYREVFENAVNDKNFKIFTHNAVEVVPVGMGGSIYDDASNLERTIKSIYIGLMVPSVIMDGSDTTYATGSIALDVLRQRYMQFRNYLSQWLKRNIFAPIAQIQGFYEYVDGEKKLIIPEIDWNHMSLFDMDSYINNLLQLSQGEGAAKRASVQTLYRSMGLDYVEEQRRMRYEDIQNAIRQREVSSLAKYSLHQLKSLGPGDEIEEITSKNEPVPGESPYEGTSGGGGGGDMGSTSSSGLGQMPGSPPPGPIGSGPAGSGSSGII